MAGDFIAALSSVFGFFVKAAGWEKDGASRLPGNKINANHNTTGKDKRNKDNTSKKRLLSYQHHRVHRVNMKQE